MAINSDKRKELREILLDIADPSEKLMDIYEYVCELEDRLEEIEQKISSAVDDAVLKMRSEFRKGDELTYTSLDRVSAMIEKRLKPRMDAFDGRLETRRVRAEEDRGKIKDLVERVSKLEQK